MADKPRGLGAALARFEENLEELRGSLLLGGALALVLVGVLLGLLAGGRL